MAISCDGSRSLQKFFSFFFFFLSPMLILFAVYMILRVSSPSSSIPRPIRVIRSSRNGAFSQRFQMMMISLANEVKRSCKTRVMVKKGWLIDDYDWPMETWLPTSRSFFFRYLERWALSRKNILTANNYWSIANVNNGVCTSTVNPCMPQDCSSWFQLLVPIYDIYIGKEASRGG